MVELAPKIRRLPILFSARVHVKFSIIRRLCLFSQLRGRGRVWIPLTTSSRWKELSRRIINDILSMVSSERIYSEISNGNVFSFLSLLLLYKEGQSNRIEWKRNVKSKGAKNATEDGERAIFITGGGEKNITLKLAAASFISLYAPPHPPLKSR